MRRVRNVLASRIGDVSALEVGETIGRGAQCNEVVSAQLRTGSGVQQFALKVYTGSTVGHSTRLVEQARRAESRVPIPPGLVIPLAAVELSDGLEAVLLPLIPCPGLDTTDLNSNFRRYPAAMELIRCVAFLQEHIGWIHGDIREVNFCVAATGDRFFLFDVDGGSDRPDEVRVSPKDFKAHERTDVHRATFSSDAWETASFVLRLIFGMSPYHHLAQTDDSSISRYLHQSSWPDGLSNPTQSGDQSHCKRVEDCLRDNPAWLRAFQTYFDRGYFEPNVRLTPAGLLNALEGPPLLYHAFVPVAENGSLRWELRWRLFGAGTLSLDGNDVTFEGSRHARAHHVFVVRRGERARQVVLTCPDPL